jgi:hypothetical protein
MIEQATSIYRNVRTPPSPSACAVWLDATNRRVVRVALGITGVCTIRISYDEDDRKKAVFGGITRTTRSMTPHG